MFLNQNESFEEDKKPKLSNQKYMEVEMNTRGRNKKYWMFEEDNF